MRDLDVSIIEQAVRDLCISANKILPPELENRISFCAGCECEELPKSIMNSLGENIEAASIMALKSEYASLGVSISSLQNAYIMIY